MRLLFPIGLLAIAGLLAFLQDRDRRRRASLDLDEEDRDYYARQETRRRRGVITLGILAIVICVGLSLDPGVKGKPNVAFVVVWAIVVLLTSGLLWFAFLDFKANFAFAQRRLKTIVRERRELFAQLRTTVSSTESRSVGDDDGNDDDHNYDAEDDGSQGSNGHHNGWKH